MPYTRASSLKSRQRTSDQIKPKGTTSGGLGSNKPDVLNVSNGYASTRHGLLKRTLYGIESKKGTPIYKTLQTCGDFTGREGTGITYVGTFDRRIYKTGVKKCKNPECPMCGPALMSKNISLLKKALTGIKMEGGEVVFITITMRPTKDPSKGIKAMMKLKQKLNKALHNNDAGLFCGDKGLGFIRIERTHSSGWAFKDEYGNKSNPFAYLNTHLHLAVGWTKRNPLSRLKRIAKQFFENPKNGLSSDIDTSYSLVDGSISNGISDLKLARQNQAAGHGWDCRFVNDEDQISQYLNKMEKQNEKLAVELNVESSKTGKGMGLFTLLEKMDKDRKNSLYNAHKKNIRAWFKEMFGKSRKSMYNLDYWVDQFKHQQKKIIEGWIIRKDLNIDKVEQAFNIVSMDWIDCPEYWEEDKLEPTIITDKLRHKDKIVFEENVDIRLYNLLRSKGYESTLEHLFKRYWFDGLDETCYIRYREVNFGFDLGKANKLIDLFHSHGLLKGSRYKNY